MHTICLRKPLGLALLASASLLLSPAWALAQDDAGATDADGSDPGAGAFVPFVIPMDMSPQSQIAFRGTPIATDAPRVVARDGHFHVGDKRLRMWGVNLSFGGNLPSHADAARLAARLEAFGINSVRMHHLDCAPFPRGLYRADEKVKWKPGRDLHPDALDRLDFLIAELAKRGIYANLNLHVGAVYSEKLGLPSTASSGSYDKIVNLFTPALIDAQKDHARRLLTRTNPYRNHVRYADDPALAFVEITNENSFFMWDGEQHTRDLHPHYADLLRTQFNAWLQKRYASREAVRAGWHRGQQPGGENVLAPPGQPKRSREQPDGWWLEEHQDCKATVTPTGAASARVTVGHSDGTGWHLQYNHPSLKLGKEAYYTLTLRARADAPRAVEAYVGQAHAPWTRLGLTRTLRLTKEWQTFRLGFIATEGDENARVNFAFGASDVAFELADVRFRPGGMEGLREGESPADATVALFADAETPARIDDRLRFLAETEKAFFDAMRSYVKNDLACGALVTGTIVMGPLGLWAQSDMDYIDAHAYWQHPQFPGKPWDMGNWIVEPRALLDHPDEAPLWDLAASRLAGKPFTVSEYNHPAPGDNQAECVPLIASFAALQDWDGVWLYSYSHRHDELDRDHFDSFFDIDANPSKWGFVPAGTVIFREGGVAPFGRRLTRGLCDPQDPLKDLVALHRRIDRSMGQLWKEATSKLAWRVSPPAVMAPLEFEVGLSDNATRADTGGTDDRDQLLWGREPCRTFNVTSPCAKVFLPPYHSDRPGRFACVLVSLDGRPLEDSRRALLTVCGRCENTGMGFSKERRTVGKAWGRGPTRVEIPRHAPGIDVPTDDGWRWFALKPDGSIAQEIPIGNDGSTSRPSTANLPPPDPKYGTMWYLLMRE